MSWPTVVSMVLLFTITLVFELGFILLVLRNSNKDRAGSTIRAEPSVDRLTDPVTTGLAGAESSPLDTVSAMPTNQTLASLRVHEVGEKQDK